MRVVVVRVGAPQLQQRFLDQVRAIGRITAIGERHLVQDALVRGNVRLERILE